MPLAAYGLLMQSGAGPAFAGSEGSGFSLEKPPPEAENRPGYPERPVFAPPAQGLATSQAGTPQSATLPAPLSGEPLAGTHSPGGSLHRFCVPPSSINCGIAATGSYRNFKFAARSTTAEAVPLLQGEGWGFPLGLYVFPSQSKQHLKQTLTSPLLTIQSTYCRI